MSHTGSIVATAVGLTLWIALTVGAERVSPVLVDVVDRVGIALGLDIVPPRRDDDASSG